MDLYSVSPIILAFLILIAADPASSKPGSTTPGSHHNNTDVNIRCTSAFFFFSPALGAHKQYNWGKSCLT